MDKSELYLMRRTKGITLKEIARYIGCSIPMVSMYERSEREFSATNKQKYEDYITQK